MSFGHVKTKVDLGPYSSVEEREFMISCEVESLRDQGYSVIVRENIPLSDGSVLIRLTSERPKTKKELQQDIKDQLEFQRKARK